jgi:8-oxo-dGTP pyrophosphatase MutT (NUDIX family)
MQRPLAGLGREASHIVGMDPILRHVAACNNAVLPGGRRTLRIDDAVIGYVDPGVLPALGSVGLQPRDGDIVVDGATLEAMARALASAGCFRWRDEAFDVRADPDGPVLATLDRGALPAFGIGAVGVHLNALVAGPDGPRLWVARRAADKLLDPGKFDHLVAGGVSAGLTPWQTLEKEAEEEAGLPASLLMGARHVGVVDYAMARDEGLRRDRLHCYDVELPSSFVPEPRDGEVEGFELWTLPQALNRVRDTDDFKFNVNLVLIDLFRRHGLLA